MKPRNKFEAKILEYSKELTKAKPVSKRQLKWAEKNIHAHYYTTHYSSVMCLECGHKFKQVLGAYTKYQDKPNNIKCPCCGKKLEFTNYGYIYAFFCVYDVYKDHQVQRIFAFNKTLVKGKKAEYYTTEVAQNWVSDKGQRASLTKQRSSYMYVDSFNYGTELEIKDVVNTTQSIKVSTVYPVIELMPILKRNGFVMEPFKDCTITSVMVHIIKNRFFEYLIKIGQYDVAKTYYSQIHRKEQTDKIESFKNQIRIASKHGYYIKNCRDYLDYLDLLVHFEKDINSPTYLCPDDFHEAHQYYVAKKAKDDSKLKESSFEVENKKYIRSKRKYFKFVIHSDDITISVPKSIGDFIYAGKALKHCIMTNKYYEKGSLILFAEKDGVLLETAEVDTKKLKLLQCRGYNNKPTKYNENIVSLIQQNIHLLNPKKISNTICG